MSRDSFKALALCDNTTFTELNHEYAKDKNYVYIKLMPNANNKTIVLKDADPVTFIPVENCSPRAVDKNHVYHGDLIVKDADPDNPETHCGTSNSYERL